MVGDKLERRVLVGSDLLESTRCCKTDVAKDPGIETLIVYILEYICCIYTDISFIFVGI